MKTSNTSLSEQECYLNTDINNWNDIEIDPLCESNEDIEKTINIFVSAVENLMNRKQWTYKELVLDEQKERLIQKIEASKKHHKSSILKKVAHSVVAQSYEETPTFEECLAEETELKLIQYRRTQEEQRAIEKSAIKASYLAKKLDIPVNNLKYLKHLFYDFSRKAIATRYNKFSKTLANQSEDIDKEWIFIRETDLKQLEIDKKIKNILKEEQNIMHDVNIEYPFYIKTLYEQYSHIFDKKLKISFSDLFADKTSIPYRLTVRMEVPIEKSQNSAATDKKNYKIEYKNIQVQIKLRDAMKAKLLKRTTILDRKTLNDFMRDNIDSADWFWMLHIAIQKVIQQEINRIKSKQMDK